MIFFKKKKVKRIKEWKEYHTQSHEMVFFELNQLSLMDNDIAIHAKIVLVPLLQGSVSYRVFYPVFENKE